MADDDAPPDVPDSEDGPPDNGKAQPEPDNSRGTDQIDGDPGSTVNAAERRQRDKVRRIKVTSLGDGDTFGGDKITYVNFRAPGTDHTWHVHVLDEQRRRRLVARFAGTPTRSRLVELLRTERIGVLQGRTGTGRRTAALAALAQHTTTLAVIDGTRTPAALRADDIEPDHGYVYDASDADWARHLTEPALLGCGKTLSSRNARLVILVSPDTDTAAVQDRVVVHEPPDTMDVLERHLRDALPDRDPDSILRQLSEKPHSPADAADLAEALVRGLQQGRSLEDICASRPDPLRHEVRMLLRQEDRNKDLGRRAFMIAWAVLDELSTVEICQAAQALAEQLFAEESRHKAAKLGLLPFGAILDQWLGHARHDPPDYADKLDRRLTSRPGFARAVLDVVWFDYVVAHRPLLAWLRDLAANHDQRIQLKAALAIGRLATHDLDYFERHCFNLWSRDVRPALRQATAWALEAVVWERPHTKDRVLEKAGRWAKSKNLPEQSTAARLYGTVLGAREPVKAMLGLRRIASRSAGILWPSLLWSVVDIFDLGAQAEVVAQLRDWTDSPFPAVRRLTALCLAELAWLDGPDRPPLLKLYDESPEQVRGLWKAVLMSPTCGSEPWKALRAWAKNDVDFASLRQDLEAEPKLRERFRFYIDRRIDRPRDEGATA